MRVYASRARPIRVRIKSVSWLYSFFDLAMNIAIFELSGFIISACLAGNINTSISSIGTASKSTLSPNTKAPVNQTYLIFLNILLISCNNARNIYKFITLIFHSKFHLVAESVSFSFFLKLISFFCSYLFLWLLFLFHILSFSTPARFHREVPLPE